MFVQNRILPLSTLESYYLLGVFQSDRAVVMVIACVSQQLLRAL